MTDTLLILAGGKSSRMKKSIHSKGLSDADIHSANTTSKGMIKIGERPFLDYVFENAKESGIKNINIVIGKDNNELKEHYGTTFLGMNITYAIQYIPEGREKPFGTADAVLQTMEQIPDLKTKPFLVCNSDNLYSIKGIKLLIETDSPNAWLNYDRNGLKFTKERVESFAITSVDANNYLLDIIEKPGELEVQKFSDSNGIIRVSMNIFKFSGQMIYPYLKNCPINPNRNEKELPTAILNMVRENPGQMLGIPIKEHVPDLTSKEDILIVRDYFKENKNQEKI